MHEYEILEKKWRKYRYKRLFFKIAIGGGIATLATATYLWLEQNPLPLPTSSTSQQNYLAPSLDFEKNLKTKYFRQKRSTTKKPHPKKIEKKESPKEETYTKRSKFFINTQKLTLEQMLQNYKKAPSIDLANMIANEYFQQKKYKKAMQWAIKANNFDTDNEESWIIYAKSAYRLGDKNKAINALKIYLYKHKSPKAQNLLEQMLQKGTQ